MGSLLSWSYIAGMPSLLPLAFRYQVCNGVECAWNCETEIQVWRKTVLSNTCWHLVADFVGATQTIIYTPLLSMSANETVDTAIRCIVTASYAKSGPVSYRLSAEEVETLPTLSKEEQASLTATYGEYVNFRQIKGTWKMYDEEAYFLRRMALKVSVYGNAGVVHQRMHACTGRK